MRAYKALSRKSTAIIGLAGLILVIAVSVNPVSGTEGGTFVPSPDYPGWLQKGDDQQGYMDFAAGHMNWALHSYYRVYERWPATWSELVDKGLFQVDLIALSGDVIDADDGTFDCFGDVYYFPPNRYTDDAFIAKINYLNGMTVSYLKIKAPKPYDQHFRELWEQYGAKGRYENSKFAYWVKTEDHKKFIGLLSVCMWALRTYYSVHGDYPHTWQEFLDSGLAPIDADSVNPLTGGPIYADSRPLDLSYEYFPAKNSQPQYFMLMPVDEFGEKPDVWLNQ